MSENSNQPERDDIKCVSNGKRMFLKLSGIALAALALDGATVRNVLANNNSYLPLPMSPQTGAVDLGSGDVGIMNYSYALEQGELAFLKRVLASPFSGITADERRVFQELHDHEVVHNEFFKAMLGSRAIPQLQTDFSKVDFNNRKSVLETSMTFADLATSAYNGAGKLLSDPANLAIAGKLVSIEARHAAVVRDLIKPRSGFFAPEALDPAREPEEVLKLASQFVKTPLNASRLPRKSGGKP
ncbi:MAG: ferritin-like domain-containing protein [Pyrinomonadaceae bacterium]|nr:ferritin-like domain-containing protein [Pyrinomonadaceae bacterium]